MKKKLNLGSPDGCAYYWDDLWREPRNFFTSQQGRDSLMVWSAFIFNGTADFFFLNSRQYSGDYENVLKSKLLPIGNILEGVNWKFQQNNTMIHTYISHSTTARFTYNQVTVIDWLATSPVLNPNGNLWWVLCLHERLPHSYIGDLHSSVFDNSEIKATSRAELILFTVTLSANTSSKHAWYGFNII